MGWVEVGGRGGFFYVCLYKICVMYYKHSKLRIRGFSNKIGEGNRVRRGSMDVARGREARGMLLGF